VSRRRQDATCPYGSSRRTWPGAGRQSPARRRKRAHQTKIATATSLKADLATATLFTVDLATATLFTVDLATATLCTPRMRRGAMQEPLQPTRRAENGVPARASEGRSAENCRHALPGPGRIVVRAAATDRRGTAALRGGGMRAEDLADVEEIKQLKARYFRLLDTKRWEEFGALFTEDARLDTTDDAPHAAAQGRDAIVALVSGGVGAAVTVHHGHMPEIEVTAPGRARAVWAMEDHLEFPGDPPALVVHGRGHYHEEYVRGGDGRWRIASLRLVRLLLTHDGRRVIPRAGG